MSPSNFARLAKAEPRLEATYVELAKWAEKHRSWNLIDPVMLARDIPDVDALSLADALFHAVQHGYFRIKYTVLTPSGVLAHHQYDSPADIPDRMPDRFEDYFNTHEYPIIAVLQSIESKSPSAANAPDEAG